MNGKVLIASDDFLAHSYGHKYISKKIGKNGKWIYTYDRPSSKKVPNPKERANQSVSRTGKKILTSLLFPRASLISTASRTVRDISDNKESKDLKEKENKVKELEEKLNNVHKDGYYYEVKDPKPGGAAEIVKISKADIEKQLIEARADLDDHKRKYTASHSYIEGNGYFIAPTNIDITHHGTDGMKWGIRNGPPYPLSKEGRAAIRRQRAEKKAAKKAEAERKLQIKKEKEEANFKAKKEKMIMGASASEVLSHRGMWTNEELKTIAKRLELEAEISSRIPRKKTVVDKLSNLNSYTKAISSFSKDVTDIWTNLKKFYKEENKNKDKDKNDNNRNQNQNQDKNKKKKSNLKETSKTKKWTGNFDWDYDYGGT